MEATSSNNDNDFLLLLPFQMVAKNPLKIKVKKYNSKRQKGGINVISSFIATDVALPDGGQKKRENLSEKTTIEKGIRGVYT